MPIQFRTLGHPRSYGAIDGGMVDDLAKHFDLSDPRRRRFVVIGEAGSGKTVAAANLLLGLLRLRRSLEDSRRAEEAVPVRVNASGWDGNYDLSSWLAKRLVFDYALRPSAARKMVDDGLILPIIDGLDEMDVDGNELSRARALLDRLNRTPWRSRPVVVVCRTQEFQRLTTLGNDRGLHGSTTVALNALSVSEIGNYLSTYQDDIGSASTAWRELTSYINSHPNSPVATALSTPWMLGLAASSVHHDPRVASQLIECGDALAIRTLLFGAQIPSALDGTDQTKDFAGYSRKEVEAWLSTLARHVEHRRSASQDGSCIRIDEIWELAGSTWCRMLHGLAVGGVTATAFILTFKLGPPSETVETFIAVAVGLFMGLLAGYPTAVLQSTRASRVALHVPTRSRWRTGVKFGLGTGLLLATILTIGLGSTEGYLAALSLALAAGGVLGLIVGLISGIGTDVEDQLALVADERRLIQNDLQAAATTFTLFLIVAILAGDRTAGWTTWIANGVAFGTAIWLAARSLVATAAYGPQDGRVGTIAAGLAAERYYIATLIFRCTNKFAARPGTFLDWARRSGLLRVSGTGYQFRHETYRLWIQQTGCKVGHQYRGPSNEPSYTA